MGTRAAPQRCAAVLCAVGPSSSCGLSLLPPSILPFHTPIALTQQFNKSAMSGGSSQLSEAYSLQSDWDDSVVSDQSTLAELLERFTIDARPECTLKLRGR